MIPLLGALAPLLGTVVDRLVPDTAEAEKGKLEIAADIQKAEIELAKSAVEVVNTEAASTHWLAANWRPLTMLIFVGLVVARWFGWTAENMTEDEYLSIYDLIKIGLGGYVAGRTIEKVTPMVMDKVRHK